MRKGSKTLIVGIAVFLTGALVVPLAFVWPILQEDYSGRQFLIPGSVEVEVAEPGRYYLWNDFQTVYEGKSYNRSKRIPDGLEITVATGDGETLPFESDASITASIGGSSRSSIGYVDVNAADRLTVAVEGGSDRQVFSFSRSGLAKVFGMVFAGFGISLLLILGGIAISIWGLVKIAKSGH